MVNDEAAEARVRSEATPVRPPHVYVHVPLCRSKCSYCDFYSIPGDEGSHAPLVEALVDEARRWRAIPATLPARTLYVGGGTPSVLGSLLPHLVSRVRSAYGVADDAEVTVEANPDTLTPRLAVSLVSVGVTRISVGVQSFDDAVLSTLDRPHDAAAARRACAAVVEAGADLAVDLICGVPGQTPASWRNSLLAAIEMGASHVSVYPLAVEEGTPMDEAVQEGRTQAPDPDVAAEMMITAEDLLSAAGLYRYEVANHARPGHESAHNSAYWTGRAYAGIGPAAHGMTDCPTAVAAGFIEDCDAGRVRYSNLCDIEGYVKGSIGAPNVEVLTPDEALREDVMLGLRRSAGVDEGLVHAAGVAHDMVSLANSGLVEWSGGSWRMTRRGWLLGNEVFGRIWTGE